MVEAVTVDCAASIVMFDCRRALTRQNERRCADGSRCSGHWNYLPAANHLGRRHRHALFAATDPIAVLAIFKRLGAPHELEVLVEGESLFNDGTAVVLSRILLGIVLAGTFDLIDGALDFVFVVGGGLLIGVIAGALVS